VTHQDRNGKAWRFDVDATPYQTLLFRRVLRAIRDVGRGAEALSLSYLADADANDAFLSTVEGVVLSALSDRYKTPTASTPAPPPKPQPRPVAEAGTNTNTDTNQDPDERKPYYWELF